MIKNFKERTCLVCSEKMYVADLRNKICISCKTRKCEICKKEFTIKCGRNQQKTCSHDCANILMQNRKTIHCDYCKSEIIVGKSDTSRRFCNKECYTQFARNHNWLNPPAKIKILNCKICKKDFKLPLWADNQHCCSTKCGGKWKSLHPTKPKTGKFVNCHRCNKEVYRAPYQFNDSDKYFCSNICVNKNKYEDLQRGFNVSKVELKFETLLNENKINFTSQYKISYNNGFKLFDFYIPEKNILIEIDGTYWHARDIPFEALKPYHIKCIENDQIKNQLALKNNYRLIRIWEDEINQFNFEILK